MALIVDLGHSQRRQSRVDDVGGRVNTEEGERVGQSGAGGGRGRVLVFPYSGINSSVNISPTFLFFSLAWTL